jgi:methionine synthase I (cobalamin-dependent)
MKRKSSLREALLTRSVIADGAMGTMLQDASPTLEDFQNHEGCNEILNVSRPDIVQSVHRQYLDVGVDAIETNTFGANFANLAEYGIENRIFELAFSGAKLAREVADEYSTEDKPRWVLGSLGPGTKLPTLGHTSYQKLKDAYATASQGLVEGGCDALLVETTQDLLQAKAAINGARQAIADSDRDIVLIVQVTVETTGTMLLGSEIGAALNALEPLDIDLIGLNCATGPAEMSEHLRSLSKGSQSQISVMPNAGLPILAANNSLPSPPFYGSKVVKGIALVDYLGMLDERALFMGQWGLKGARGEYEKMVETEGRPLLRSLLNEVQSQGWLNAAVVYGYFPCYSEGNDLVVLHHEGPDKGKERVRFSFPRQRRDRRLCLSDFYRSKESGEIDTVAFHIVTMGQSVSEATSKLFAANNYREYLELHGLSVQLAEALAEHWHARIRQELSFGSEDSPDITEILDQGYRGSRYSFGYPACPDLEQQVQLCQLLEPERIGVELSEEFQLHPEQSTSAIIVHHPEAKYFNAV